MLAKDTMTANSQGIKRIRSSVPEIISDNNDGEMVPMLATRPQSHMIEHKNGNLGKENGNGLQGA